VIEGGCGKYTVHYTLHASDVTNGACKAEVHWRGRKGEGEQ